MRFIVCVFLGMLLSFNSVLAQNDNNKHNIAIEILAEPSDEADVLSATAFGVSLAGWVNENEDISTLKRGIYQPSFNALVDAFTSQLTIWRQLKEKPESVYMKELLLVDNAGFLEEYIWLNHMIKQVQPDLKNLKITKYREWKMKNIPNHKPKMEAQLRIQ